MDLNERITQADIEIFHWLNDRRTDPDAPNMYGVAPEIYEEFGMTSRAASRRVLSLWMKHFNEEDKYDHLL